MKQKVPSPTPVVELENACLRRFWIPWGFPDSVKRQCGSAGLSACRERRVRLFKSERNLSSLMGHNSD
jgi:hypothetical protein